VSGGLKNYTYKNVNGHTQETNTVRVVQGITVNYAVAKLVNFDSIQTMILGSYVGVDINVRTDRKIKLKLRSCGPPSPDLVTVVSKPEEVHRVSSQEHRRNTHHTEPVPPGTV
jgi:hypothetical protein